MSTPMDFSQQTPSSTQSFTSTMSQNQPSISNISWSLKEDRRLLMLAKQTNKNWKMVSRILNNPIATPCIVRNRYDQLQSVYNAKKKRFTYLEDLIIMKAMNKINSKWVKISEEFLPFRTPMEIKNRFYCSIRKRGVENQLLQQYKIFESNTKLNVEDYLFHDTASLLTEKRQRTIDYQPQYQTENQLMIQSLRQDVKDLNLFAHQISCNISQILQVLN